MDLLRSNKDMDYSKNDLLRNCFKLAASIAMLTVALFFSSPLHAQTFGKQPDGKGKPKYIFLSIGDGMSYPQIQSAAYYLGKDAAGIVDNVKNRQIQKTHQLQEVLAL